MTGGVFSPVAHPHGLVLGVAVACALLLWLAIVVAIELLSRRRDER